MQNEIKLLEKARKFDQEAWAEIYDCYNPGLYAYAYRLLGDADQAEDCVAETFHRCLVAMRGGGGPQDHLQAYLYRIAHNYITDIYRRQPLPPLLLDEELHQADVNTEGDALLSLTRQQVRAALTRLTDEQRQVVSLKFYEGWDNADIASALNKPIGAVKSLQVRALASLRRLLIPAAELDEESTYVWN
jgi:RNA polymerase sigma-70 factor (ECF subfamily)